MHEPADAPAWRELLWIVPVATGVMFLPPLVTNLDGAATVFGIPILPLYIFAVWACAIVITAVLARRLGRGIGPGGGPE